MDLVSTLVWATGPGAGIVIKAALDWLIGEMADKGRSPSPKTRRRLSYLVSLSLPSLIIAVLIPLGHVYDFAEHLTAILSAFGVSQVVHGESNLATGTDQRVEAVFAKPAAVVTVPKIEAARDVLLGMAPVPPVVRDDGEEVK